MCGRPWHMSRDHTLSTSAWAHVQSRRLRPPHTCAPFRGAEGAVRGSEGGTCSSPGRELPRDHRWVLLAAGCGSAAPSVSPSVVPWAVLWEGCRGLWGATRQGLPCARECGTGREGWAAGCRGPAGACLAQPGSGAHRDEAPAVRIGTGGPPGMGSEAGKGVVGSSQLGISVSLCARPSDIHGLPLVSPWDAEARVTLKLLWTLARVG